MDLIISKKYQSYLVHPPFASSRARHESIQGKKYTFVPFSIPNAVALRSRGFAAGSPMLYDGFDFKFPPPHRAYPHQKITASFLTLHRRAFCFNGMGTGKTAAAIWAAEYLRQRGLIRRVLIVSPLSTLSRTWVEEVKRCALGASYEVVHGTQASRDKAVKSKATYLIINHDGIKHTEKALLEQGDIDLIIADEATAFKTHNTDRTKAFSRVVQKDDRRLWAMTGTPMTGMPTDMWALARLICPDKVPTSFTKFRDQTCYAIGPMWKPRAGSTDLVLSMLQPSICFLKEECISLPDVVRTEVAPALTTTQSKYLKALKNDYMATLSCGTDITAANQAIVLSKSMQILQGVVRKNTMLPDDNDDDETCAFVDAQPRMAALKDVIDSSLSKTIVFATFRGAVKEVSRELKKEYGAEYIDGSVSLKKRTAILERFDNDPTMRVLVAQPSTMSHGINATVASTIAWWGPCFSAETYTQACERVNRPGQKHKMTIVHLVGHPIEDKIYKNIQSKLTAQSGLLETLSLL